MIVLRTITTLTCLAIAWAQQPDFTDALERANHRGGRSCYDEYGRPQRCHPVFENAAFNLPVDATNTCGVDQRIDFCMQTGVTGAKQYCDICDASIKTHMHPPNYLTDFSNNDNLTWWQSETMLQGIQYPNVVNLTLHLGKAFDITYIRLKFHSPRPESFAIYKRTSENSQWIPYQFYSATCRDTYHLPDYHSGRVTVRYDNESMCTSEFSDISPLTGGNVAFSTLDARPNAYNFENSPVLHEWVTATDIMIILARPNTFGDEVFGDPKVLKSYYYAISDFAVGGRCKCNGHASECAMTRDRRQQCRCQHNTEGVDCELCQEFYNDKPWGRATERDTRACVKCNCNGRSEKCRFDPDLWERTGQRTGGHCYDCRNNTSGPNCEKCLENYYDRWDKVCVACNCHPVGSRHLQCNQLGLCQCKVGVNGERCDRCSPNFYEFGNDGCKSCGCSTAGSYESIPNCDTNTGLCQCKVNVEGRQCDSCKLGYFNLDVENEFGCTPCFCYGHSSVCQSATGYSRYDEESNFRRDSEKWTAVDQIGDSVPLQHNVFNYLISATAPPHRESIFFKAPNRYHGDQRASYNRHLVFTLKINSEGPRPSVDDVVIEGPGFTISQPIFGQNNALPSTGDQEYKFRLHENPQFGWNPRLGTKDFLSLLTNITSIKIRATYTPGGIGYLSKVRLESAQRGNLGREATWIESCTCPEGYIGQHCESCAPKFRHDPPGGGPFARCVPCNCNGHADLCDSHTGRCICRHNTAGVNCERCAKGFYGNALQATADDCKPCPCPNQGACVELATGDIACLECPAGYAGPRCELCTDGYFGDPQGRYGPPSSCQKCDCNDNIDLNAVGNCNRTTGSCLKCIYHTSGDQCEHCQDGFYGNALASPRGDCKPCNCYLPGSQLRESGGATCNPVTGQCDCQAYVRGLKCDHCQDGFWNIDSGEGCQACNCDTVGSLNQTCNILTGQCFCQRGVTGLHCDKCLPYHYGFSYSGCIPCDCDPVGSNSSQCDPNGQCPCRTNVEGRRCDRCKENTQDKKAGCVDCPACYNLVQDAVNVHRDKLAGLGKLIDEIERDPKIIDDKDFDKKLRELTKRVKDLLRSAQSAGGEDLNLVLQLQDLHERIDKVIETSIRVDDKMVRIKSVSALGVSNITEAERALDRAVEYLKNARRKVEFEGRQALQLAEERAEKFGHQSGKMSLIARESRQEADRQEGDVEAISVVANEALNTSTDAFNIVKDSVTRQHENTQNINQLQKELNDLSDLLARTKQMAGDAQRQAKEAYDRALDIYTEANGLTLPDVDTTKLEKESRRIIEEAKKLQKTTEDLQNANRDLIDELTHNIHEAEQLYTTAQEQQQIADGLFSDVDVSRAKADEAVKLAEKTLSDARTTLETLRGFDTLVQESKKKATDALKEVPVIQQLIEESERKVRDASDQLLQAERDANSARDIAKNAQQTAEQASRDSDKVKQDSNSIQNRAGQLKDDSDSLAKDMAGTSARIKEFEDQAGQDSTLSREALERANAAKNSARDTSTKVNKALDSVENILKALENLADIDETQLRELERKLDQAEQEVDNPALDQRVTLVTDAYGKHNQDMRNYEDELARLRKDVENIHDISKALPSGCFKRNRLEPPP